MVFSLRRLGFALLGFLGMSPISRAVDPEQIIKYTGPDNEVVYLRDNRKPALYTKNFGDCLGPRNTAIKVSRFDASLYKDNMTVTFHIGGSTSLRKENIMVYIGVYAYGQNRFEIAFNPCGTNMHSLCPAQAGVPIEANGFIPLGEQDVNTIPPIALSIPDFEGQAILRIFANSTQSEIACYTALVTNGATFNQQDSVGVILGLFTMVAVASSFATTIYGDSIASIRTHYAHSVSVFVVFAVFHHIFFSGALSLNWPSNLVAFWSNFAWSAGMIYAKSMQDSFSKIVGKHRGNTLILGAAGSGSYAADDVGGGYDTHKIYKRHISRDLFNQTVQPQSFEKVLGKRSLANSTSGFRWYGEAVRPGLPLPGNFSGFAGTLSEIGIPASNAFLTGLVWILILVVIVAGSITLFKLVLDALHRYQRLKSERMHLFRKHWRSYVALALLRTAFIAFFAIIFLCVFQFTYNGSPALIALAAIVFVVTLVGMSYLTWRAFQAGRNHGAWMSQPEVVGPKKRSKWNVFGKSKPETDDSSLEKPVGSWKVWRLTHKPLNGETPIHENEEFIRKHGWLASRFRLSRWWFFAPWLVYELIKAIWLAGAASAPLVQVVGIIIIELAAMFAILKIRPFEGQRLNIIMVYLLGISKVLTPALSIAFDVQFNIARIPATAIGIVIIVIQGLLTIALLVAICLGAISSYFSVTRNRDTIKPRRWMPYKKRYLEHIAQAATDLPPDNTTPEDPPQQPKSPQDPYFSVNSVRRVAKIEDEDADFQKEIATDPRFSHLSVNLPMSPEDTPPQFPIGMRGARDSRTASICSNVSYSSTFLPYGARVHRGSWSTRDLSDFRMQQDNPSVERLRTPISVAGLSAPAPLPSTTAGIDHQECSTSTATTVANPSNPSTAGSGNGRAAAPWSAGDLKSQNSEGSLRSRTAAEDKRTMSPVLESSTPYATPMEYRSTNSTPVASPPVAPVAAPHADEAPIQQQPRSESGWPRPQTPVRPDSSGRPHTPVRPITPVQPSSPRISPTSASPARWSRGGSRRVVGRESIDEDALAELEEERDMSKK